MAKPKKVSFTHGLDVITLTIGEYGLGGVSLNGYAFHDESGCEVLYTVFSCFIDNAVLPDGEFWLKDWKENAGPAADLISSGLIEPTGREKNTGFVTARSYKFAGKLLDAYKAQSLFLSKYLA